MAELRSLLRLARRTARRNLLRTVLVVLLIAVPVGAASAAAIGIRNTKLAPEEQARSVLGLADIGLSAWNPTPAALQWIRAELANRVDGSTVEWRTADAAVGAGGAAPVSYAEIIDADLADPVFEGKFLLDGRVPSAPDEVVLSPPFLTDTRVGERITLVVAGTELDLIVVGEVVDPYYVDRPLVALSPAGFDRVPTRTVEDGGIRHNWLIAGKLEAYAIADDFRDARAGLIGSTAPQPQPGELADVVPELYAALTPEGVAELTGRAAGLTPEELNALAWELADPALRDAVWGVEVSERGPLLAPSTEDLVTKPPVLGTLAAGLLLAEVALVAAAAYATGIRRRLREIGLLASVGASTRQVKAVVLGEAAVAGVVGAALGVAAGVGAAHLATPFLENLSDRLIVNLRVSPLDVIGPGLAGVAAAVVAAWLPARTAARAPALAALNGRIPLSEPPRWITPAAIGLSGFGLFLLLAARDSVGQAGDILGGLAVVLTILGAAGLAVPITAALARRADRLPATLRLVVRDAGRQRTRAAAAIAALLVVLVAPVTVATALEGEARQRTTHSLPDADDQVLALNNGYLGPEQYSADEAQLAAVGEILPDAEQFPLDVLDVPAVIAVPLVYGSGAADGSRPIASDGFLADWDLGVAVPPPGFLDALGVPGAQQVLDSGTPVVLGTRHDSLPMTIGAVAVEARMYPVRTVALMPRVLVPAEVAAAGGAPALGTAVAFVNPTPLDAGQRLAIDGLDFTAVRGYPPSLTTGETQLLAVGIALGVALLIVAMVIALSATESDRDLGVMVAVGAPPRLRRSFLAWQAAYYMAVAALLATPVALLLIRTATEGGHIAVGRFGAWDTGTVAVPWDMIGLVLVAIPLAAALATGMVVRSAPTRPPRRID